MERYDYLINFGKQLQMFRKQRGLSQEQLAFLCGLDRSYVGSVERGERNISLINLIKLANALEISLSDLLSSL